jgi:hypothetical protein
LASYAASSCFTRDLTLLATAMNALNKLGESDGARLPTPPQ